MLKTQLISAETLLTIEGHVELVQGEIVAMSPAGNIHGEIALAIGALLWHHIYDNKLGKTYAAETGFILSRNPDTVRAPDVAFVSNERLAQLPQSDRGFFEGAPDLAVEVISPSETAVSVATKVEEYLFAGVRLIWLIYPQTKTITVYASHKDIQILTKDDTLTGGSLLPNFSTPVAKIFPN